MPGRKGAISERPPEPIIVRLACCCGLRVSEIAALQLDDVIVVGPQAALALRRATTKGKKSRLSRFGGMRGARRSSRLEDRTNTGEGERSRSVRLLGASAATRPSVATARDPSSLLVGVQGARIGEIRRLLTIHHGRHTFISSAGRRGRTLAEVRAAAGHANVAVTSAYLHIAVDDEEQIGNLFA